MIRKRHKSISRQGIRINYEICTPESFSRTIVFLHGLGGDHTVWEEYRNHFTNHGFRTIAIDLRSHGKSSRPLKEDDYALDKFAEDVKRIIEYEDIQSAILVGHCLGGMISLLCTKICAKLLDGLILIDTGFDPPDYAKMVRNNPYLYTFAKLLLKHSPRFYRKKYADFQRFKGGHDLNLHRIGSDMLRVSLQSYFAVCDSISNFDASEIIKSINVPTLIIHGLKDIIIKKEVADKMNHEIKNSFLHVIPNGNHITVINNTDEIILAIDSFISRLDDTRAQ